jgi:hypothetical protein
MRLSWRPLLLRPDLLFNQPVPALRWNTKLLRRLLKRFTLLGRLDGSEMFSAFADDVYAPASHQRRHTIRQTSIPTRPIAMAISSQRMIASIIFY